MISSAILSSNTYVLWEIKNENVVVWDMIHFDRDAKKGGILRHTLVDCLKSFESHFGLTAF